MKLRTPLHVLNVFPAKMPSLPALAFFTLIFCGLSSGFVSQSLGQSAEETASQIVGTSSTKSQSGVLVRNELSQVSSLPTRFWPKGVRFNSEIPTPKQFFGFDIGFRHLRHDQIVSYLKELDRKSDRISLSKYGQTHGGRPLLLATITSPSNHQNLDKIQTAHRSLAKGQGGDVDKDLPVVMNMGYSVHGDEPSAGNCAPLVAYYLAAAEGQAIEKTLNSVVVLLDPVLNPDGFDRFARWANDFRGQILNPDPAHAEHRQGWPAGRVNYYWFDLNRDWLPLVHPESRARMNWYHRWKPNIVLDFHEMGTHSTFFFQPGVPNRTNPLTPLENIALTGQIGKYHAKSFDKQKVPYFTQEVFDDFYMGKGSTYPDLHGAIGILFEQGSSRGHLQESVNGLVDFPQTISNQFTASLSSLKAATEMRNRLNHYKRSFYDKSLKLAQEEETKYFAFNSPGNASRLNQFATILKKHDIACFRAKGDAAVQAGLSESLIVPLVQPEYRFLKSLTDQRTDFKENIFYDVSAWTLHHAYDLEMKKLSEQLDEGQLASWQDLVLGQQEKLDGSIDQGDVAVVVDWRDDRAAKWMYKLLSKGLNIKVATRPLQLEASKGTVTFGRGSFVILLGLKANQSKGMATWVSQMQSEGLLVHTVKTGLNDQGPDLGSGRLKTLKMPKAAMLIQGSVSSYRSGEVWHALDSQLQMPLSLIKRTQFDSVNLDRYNVLVLASGRYGFSVSEMTKLNQWIEKGGTLIAQGSAGREVAGQRSVRSVRGSSSRIGSSRPSVLPFESASKRSALKLISGAIFDTEIDLTHPMFYGFPRENLRVFKNHNRVLSEFSSQYGVPMVYKARPLVAGYASKANVAKLAGTAAVSVVPSGKGRTIYLSDSFVFRGFWKGTQKAFFNAIFFRDILDPPGR